MLNRPNINKLTLKLSLIIVLVIVLGSLHFFTDEEMSEAYQHFYYIPIILAGVWFGWVGGLVVSLIISMTYIFEIIVSPFNSMGLYSEILFYILVGVGTGFLVNMEKKQGERLEKTSEELNKVYEKLQNTYEMLRQSDRLALLGQLAAGLSHEIRNPLGSIRGAVDILEDEISKENKKYEFVLIIKDEIKRLNQLLTQFTRYAKPPELELRKVEINEMISPVISLIRATAKHDNVKIITELDDNLPLFLADSEQLKQVFFNIILNGVQSMPSGGNLKIKTARKDNNLEVSVEDEGIGIETEKLPKIFDPFFTTKEDGTGLGLAISYQLVKKHGGNISIQPNTKQGLTFSVIIPIEQKNGN